MIHKELLSKIINLNKEGKISFTEKGKVICKDEAVVRAFEEIPTPPEIIARGFDAVISFLEAFG
jgi:hypothetical protein